MRDADAIHVGDHIDDHRQPQHSMSDASWALLRWCGSSHRFVRGWLLWGRELGMGSGDFHLAATIPRSPIQYPRALSTTLSRGSPLLYRRTFSVTSAISRTCRIGALPELCGVMTRFGQSQRGLSGGSGSGVTTSSPAPRIHFSFSALISAS